MENILTGLERKGWLSANSGEMSEKLTMPNIHENNFLKLLKLDDLHLLVLRLLSGSFMTFTSAQIVISIRLNDS